MKSTKTKTSARKYAKIDLVYTENSCGIYRNGVLVDTELLPKLSLTSVFCTMPPSDILDALKIPYTSHWLGYRPPGWHFPKKFSELKFE